MIVYRLEKNGEGPFYGIDKGFDPDIDTDIMPDVQRLAKPINYTIYQYEDMSHFYYGCNTLKQLQDYFGGLWRAAIRDGYRVKRYWVDRRDIRFSDYIELAFRKDGNYHEVPNFEKVKDI